MRDLPLVEGAFPKSKLPGDSVSAQSARPGAALYVNQRFRITAKAAREGYLSLRAERSNPYSIGAPSRWADKKCHPERNEGSPPSEILRLHLRMTMGERCAETYRAARAMMRERLSTYHAAPGAAACAETEFPGSFD